MEKEKGKENDLVPRIANDAAARLAAAENARAAPGAGGRGYIAAEAAGTFRTRRLARAWTWRTRRPCASCSGVCPSGTSTSARV